MEQGTTPTRQKLISDDLEQALWALCQDDDDLAPALVEAAVINAMTDACRQGFCRLLGANRNQRYHVHYRLAYDAAKVGADEYWERWLSYTK